jgi:hypothetical protein
MNRRIIRHDQPERLWVPVLVFMVALSIVGLLCVDEYESRPPPDTWERFR